VLPAESTDEPFNWKESLADARSALKHGGSTAAAALFKAFADAARMAEFCHDKLLEMEPGKIPDDTLSDWSEFLQTLYKDTLKVYRTHTDLAPPDSEGSMQTMLEAVSSAARAASFGLKYMDVEKSEQEGREAEVVKLGQLMIQLQAVVAKLESELQVHQGDETAPEAEETQADIVTEEVVYVPRVGLIAAGRPILAAEAIEDIFPLPRQLVGYGKLFLLAVRGDSMIGIGIAEGDLVVVREQPQAENGEIVVAMIDGEATVKQFKMSDGHAWLEPHNSEYQKTLAKDAIITGKVVAVLRKV
jgi:SOS regulatory protein LexA